MAICPDNFRLAGHFDQTHKQATRNKTTRPYFLLVTLVRSSLYYLVIFNILTGQIREETETIFNDVHTRSSCGKVLPISYLTIKKLTK